MKVDIIGYDSDWEDQFLGIKKKLHTAFDKDLFLYIEHIGSTAVPGLAAKNIIDILMGVEKISAADGMIPGMIGLGYEYVPKYEDVMPERRYFVMREGVKQNVHTVVKDSEFWNRNLLFRDYLRLHDDARDMYYDLKKMLADKEWESGNDYAYAKTDFIRAIEVEAKHYFSVNK